MMPGSFFPHDHARSRAYRWNEDGMAGLSDIHHDLCFALALWNGVDPILKERNVRPYRAARKPWRGRQGVLVVSGRCAEAMPGCAGDTTTPRRARISGSSMRTAAVPATNHRSSSSWTPGAFDHGRYKVEVEVLRQGLAHRRAICAVTIKNMFDFRPHRVLPTLWFLRTWCGPAMTTSLVDARWQRGRMGQTSPWAALPRLEAAQARR